jgi:hypothetical protein
LCLLSGKPDASLICFIANRKHMAVYSKSLLVTVNCLVGAWYCMYYPSFNATVSRWFIASSIIVVPFVVAIGKIAP